MKSAGLLHSAAPGSGGSRHDEFEFLFPTKKEQLRPDEVASVLNRSPDFVLTMIHEGKLEAFAPVGREKARYQITRRSVLRLLAEQANFQPDEYVKWLKEGANHLSRKCLVELSSHVAALRQKHAC